MHGNQWSVLHPILPYPCFSGKAKSILIMEVRAQLPSTRQPPARPAALLNRICVTQHLHDEEFLPLESIPKSSEVMWQI